MGKVWDVLAPRDLELGPLAGRERAGSPWRNWWLARDDDGIAWLALDKANASANTLSEDVLAELNDVLASLERDLPKGLVLRSAKPKGFIAGADIGEFRGMTDAAAVQARLIQAHAVVDRLDRLATPTVAVVHGYCLGGGLEIALACDYRIGLENASLGFPEVLLGLHPGLGGTVRLPRLINPLEAMTMMLTGRSVRAGRAKSLGLVEAVVPERHVKAAATAAVTGQLKKHRGGFLGELINSTYGRKLAAKRMRAETEKKAPAAHYPAPYALIDLWETHGGNAQDMQRAEIASFARLVVTDTSRNLVRVFFLREKLKSLADGDFSGQHVHVIGAGAMGGDIAAWCAWHGFTVTLADTQAEPIAKAIGRAADLYGKIGHRRIDIRDALDRLTPDLAGEGVRSADLVIEAVPETLELKRKVFAATEPKMRPGAILAKARAFLGRIDRLPAPVQSAPGFLVNRALTPYMLEALVMLNAGEKRETIDAAAETFGMPMGPIELADTVGLDICLHVAEMLKASLDRPMPDVSRVLRDKVEMGQLGRKSGRGFYEWRRGQAVKEREAPKPTPEMTDRLILPMLDVCVTCLREGVVADEDTLDGAMIFATGFAPFRGGPMHYARSRGAADIRAELERLAQRYGERFRPDPGWDLLA
jgi:3-hydroxyacyl-CoA dehydrogenase / enoyl-CoA hydratase / 3-hydroxybutyryl-CoA epimerase